MIYLSRRLDLRTSIVVVFNIMLLGLCGTTSADSADDYFQQTTIRCYACTLIQSIHDERDHYQGPTGCADPFDDVDIPRVPCDSACGKVLIKTEDGYLLTRSCLSNCKQKKSSDDGSYTECCYRDLCNTAASLYNINSRRHLFTALFTSLITLLTSLGFPMTS